MRELFKTRYFKFGLTLSISLIAVVLFFFLLNEFSTVHVAFGSLIKIVAPFLYGVIMAYLLRPVYDMMEYNTTKFLKWANVKSKKTIKTSAKIVSITVSIMLLIAVVAALFMMVIPQLMTSIYDLIVNLPKNAVKLINWIESLPFVNDQLKGFATEYIDNMVNNLDKWMSGSVIPYLKDMALKISAGLVGAASFVLDVLIGLIVCVYILLGKKVFSAQAKKAAYAIFEKDTANTLINGVRFADNVFTSFISGNIVDAVIIGFLTFLVMSVFNWPFALLISTIVGVTNLIPFFGPFIGGAIGAILILPDRPATALYFLIFILILQQVDGNVIKPKILGQSVNLSSFWILFAIIVGGGMFGLVGIILGVPVFTIIYTFITWLLDKRLSRKNLSLKSVDYSRVDYYDFDKGEFVYLPSNLYEERRNKKRTQKKAMREYFKKKKEEFSVDDDDEPVADAYETASVESTDEGKNN